MRINIYIIPQSAHALARCEPAKLKRRWPAEKLNCPAATCNLQQRVSEAAAVVMMLLLRVLCLSCRVCCAQCCSVVVLRLNARVHASCADNPAGVYCAIPSIACRLGAGYMVCMQTKSERGHFALGGQRRRAEV